MLRILCGVALLIATVSAFPNLQERAESCTTADDCANDTCHGHDNGGNIVCAIHHGDTGVCHCEHHHHHTPHPHPAIRAETCTTAADCANDTCHGHDNGGNIVCAIHHGDTGVCHCEHHHHHTPHPHPAIRAETCTTAADCANDTCHGHDNGGNIVCAIHHGDTGVCHCEHHHHHTPHPHPAIRAETCTTAADCANDTCHGHDNGGNIVCAIHHGDTGVCHCEHHHHHTPHPHPAIRAETCTTADDCANDTCHGHDNGGNIVCAIHHGDTGVCHCEHHHHHTPHPHPAIRAETCTTAADCANDTCHGHDNGGNIVCAIHHGDTGVCHCEHHHHTPHPHPAIRAETCTTAADCANDTCHGHDNGGNIVCAIHHGDTGVCHCEHHHHHTPHPHPAIRAETCTTAADCANDTCHGHDNGGNIVCAIHHGDTGVCHCEHHHHHTPHPHPAIRAETCTTADDCANDTCHGHDNGGHIVCAIHHGDTGVCHCEHHHHHTPHPHPAIRAESCTTAADCANDTCHGHDNGGNIVCAIHHGDTGVCHCEHHHHHTPHPHPAIRAETCTTAADCANDTCHGHDNGGNIVCAIHHGDTGVCHCEHHHHHTPHPHPVLRNEKCFNDTDCPPSTCHGQDGVVTCDIHHVGHEGICHCTHTEHMRKDELNDF
ncbi:uncharacterized protein LOC125649881 [Ostrea edulis]|uniref:uncharacterized protein LOC125649881 n=1 Tax=Ostrea edulis TaxID=37623 RepID=UPI0024AFAFD8|nr:uncharacterized protein LOC125649881 [Ostrea edulis]